MYRHCFKRIFDFIISCGCILFSAPFMLIILLYIYLKTGENPLFFQQRPGLNGKIFTLIKLKTMNDLRDEHGVLLPDKQRTTSFGNFLRKTSLDELPQLFNVLKGEMSLIGPRPLLIRYLPLYSQKQSRRHELRPGITGWAQVNGRNAISWQQKFDLDVWYVDHVSFMLDLKILLLTIKKVFTREDINYTEEITMPEFNGHN